MERLAVEQIHILNARGRLAEFVATCEEQWVALLYAVAMAREPVLVTDNCGQQWGPYYFADGQAKRLANSMQMEATWESLTQEVYSENNSACEPACDPPKPEDRGA
jgi:hypothetical protein